MFGMTVFYRQEIIFAALPKTRSLETPDSVAFRLLRPGRKTIHRLRAEPELRMPPGREKGWIAMEIRDSGDANRALQWFRRAYESSASQSKSR